jgi:hypothetical protein
MTGTRKPVVMLQERDRRLLAELASMRVINREQAKIIAGFHSTTRANTRLLALTRAGLLKRIFIGRNEAAYLLSGTLSDAGGRQDKAIGAILFARHQLSINELYLKISYEPIPQARLIRWLRFSEPLSKSIPLIPDSYLELDFIGTLRPMFLEVDLGTEPLTVWKRKIQLYLQLAVSGEFSKIFLHPQFRVLVVVPSDRRLDGIRRLVAKSTDKIFWFATFETINREGLWSPVWLRPTGDQKHSLM